jgi:hypothetical protein
MAYKVRMRGARNIKIGRVVTKIVIVVLSLYVGGTILTEIGNVIANTTSPFYVGLTLIGYTVGSVQNNVTDFAPTCGGTITSAQADPGISTCVTATDGTGILTVVGLVGIASVIMEFVEFSRIG